MHSSKSYRISFLFIRSFYRSSFPPHPYLLPLPSEPSLGFSCHAITGGTGIALFMGLWILFNKTDKRREPWNYIMLLSPSHRELARHHCRSFERGVTNEMSSVVILWILKFSRASFSFSTARIKYVFPTILYSLLFKI